MSSDILKLKIITPDKIVFDDFVNHITFNTIDGIVSLQKNYSSIIGSLKAGKLTIYTSSGQINKIVGKGAYIISDNNLEIISGFCLDDTEENINMIESTRTKSFNWFKEKINYESNAFNNINITKLVKQLRKN